jgi:hypothetical protein
MNKFSRWMGSMLSTKVCFRNDDVNSLTEPLMGLTEILLKRKVPITHAVEPGNVTIETIHWLKQLKSNYPHLIEIIQHGWNHTFHVKGEFGGGRSYEEQFIDLKQGKEKMERIFKEDFFPVITVPWDLYNKVTIKAANQLGFKVFCVHYDYRISRRLFYSLGHFLGRGQLFGKPISNHLKCYPGTQMLQIDTAISLIKRYFDLFGNECEFFSTKEILSAFNKVRKLIPVVVFLFHHKYHQKGSHFQLVEDVLDELQHRKDVDFVSHSRIYADWKAALRTNYLPKSIGRSSPQNRPW